MNLVRRLNIIPPAADHFDVPPVCRPVHQPETGVLGIHDPARRFHYITEPLEIVVLGMPQDGSLLAGIDHRAVIGSVIIQPVGPLVSRQRHEPPRLRVFPAVVD